MSDPPKFGERHVRRQIGMFLMACGALIVILCGGCSCWVLLNTAPDTGPGGEFYGRVFYGGIAVIGGLPTLLGVIMFVVGFRRFRRP
jgi:hypothetical protein